MTINLTKKNTGRGLITATLFPLLVHQELLQMVRSIEVDRNRPGAIPDGLPTRLYIVDLGLGL